MRDRAAASQGCESDSQEQRGVGFEDHLQPLQTARTSGTFEGSARALNAADEMLSAALQGIWRRNGRTIELHSLDLASNGDRNFVTTQLDIISKTSRIAVYSL